MEDRRNLTRFAWLSIAAALFTILLKAGAFLLTGSVGLLSDALESGVNLAAAIFALVTLTIAALPPDEEHAYGHAKAEYFSCGAEGTMILIAALTIAYSAARRLIDPQPLEQLGLGLLVSAFAALANLAVARVLLKSGRQRKSVTLTAGAQHLMTDVWTSGGVIVGVAAVALTDWQPLDSIVALLVALQILYAGTKLVRQAVLGLMDTALPAEELERAVAVLDRFKQANNIRYHALRSRESGAQRFLSVHIQVPGSWSVQRGHTMLEELEREIRQSIPLVSVFTHLEPVEDPVSWQDVTLQRVDA
jgi:cation diffusion facilitator family transporter